MSDRRAAGPAPDLRESAPARQESVADAAAAPVALAAIEQAYGSKGGIRPDGLGGRPLPAGAVLQLQRSVGNRAAQGLLADRQSIQRTPFGTRPGEQKAPGLGSAHTDASLEARLAALKGGAAQDRGLAGEIAAHEQANPDAALEARLAALKGGAAQDPGLAGEIAAHEHANPDAALEARLAALKGGAAQDPGLAGEIAAHEHANPDAALEARLAALKGGAAQDPGLAGEIAAHEHANPDAALEARLAALKGGAAQDPGLAGEIAAHEQANPDAALEARLAALKGGAAQDPGLAGEIAAHEQANPDAALEARLAALKGGAAQDPGLAGEIAVKEQDDAAHAVSLVQFSVGAGMVESSLNWLKSTYGMVVHAVGACSDVTPAGAVLIMQSVEQIGATMAAMKATLDQGSNLLSGARPGDPTRASLLAQGKRNIEEVKLVFSQIEQAINILRPMAAEHLARQHTAFASPHMAGSPFHGAGFLQMLLTSLPQAIVLGDAGLATQRAATQVAQPESTQLEGLQFPAVPVREQAAEQQPDLQLPDIPVALGENVKEQSPLAQPSSAGRRGDSLPALLAK